MSTKAVFHDWNKVLFNVDYQSIRVFYCTRYADPLYPLMRVQ